MLHLKAIAAITTLSCAGEAGAATTNGIANGDFETAGGPPAAGWSTVNSPAQWSTDAHTGSHSVLLSVPGGFGASTLLQNSTGSLAPLTAANVGDTPTLSFWAKGSVSPTGNISVALRYLGADGGIVADTGHQFFHSQLNTSTWSQISFQSMAIPTGAAAVFLEFHSAVGPLEGGTHGVYLDDVQLALNVAAVPEPETYALLIAGLGVVGAMARRRRA